MNFLSGYLILVLDLIFRFMALSPSSCKTSKKVSSLTHHIDILLLSGEVVGSVNVGPNSDRGRGGTLETGSEVPGRARYQVVPS